MSSTYVARLKASQIQIRLLSLVPSNTSSFRLSQTTSQIDLLGGFTRIHASAHVDARPHISVKKNSLNAGGNGDGRSRLPGQSSRFSHVSPTRPHKGGRFFPRQKRLLRWRLWRTGRTSERRACLLGGTRWWEYPRPAWTTASKARHRHTHINTRF